MVKKRNNWQFKQPEHLGLVFNVLKRILKNQFNILNLELTVSEKYVFKFHLYLLSTSLQTYEEKTLSRYRGINLKKHILNKIKLKHLLCYLRLNN